MTRPMICEYRDGDQLWPNTTVETYGKYAPAMLIEGRTADGRVMAFIRNCSIVETREECVVLCSCADGLMAMAFIILSGKDFSARVEQAIRVVSEQIERHLNRS